MRIALVGLLMLSFVAHAAAAEYYNYPAVVVVKECASNMQASTQCVWLEQTARLVHTQVRKVYPTARLATVRNAAKSAAINRWSYGMTLPRPAKDRVLNEHAWPTVLAALADRYPKAARLF